MKTKGKNISIGLRIITMLLLSGIVSISSIAQDADKLAKEFLDEFMSGKADPAKFNQIMELPNGKVLEAFAVYTKDSLPQVRLSAYYMICNTGVKTREEKTKRKSVKLLVTGLDDKESEIIGRITGYLQEFPVKTFDKQSLYIINRKIQDHSPYFSKLVLLSGYLQITDLIYQYKKMLAEAGKYKQGDRWVMLLAMARMGDKEAIAQVMEKAGKLPVNDDVVYEIYPNLAYTRQKEAFSFLLKIIQSDGKDCRSSNPDNEKGIVCAFRVIEYVAPYIKNFPAVTDKSGMILSNDYDKVLNDVRQWIKENEDNYSLIEERY